MIIVPAGGYVVIEFLAKNPGWWFMHCHIDYHLNYGMAIAVGELTECQVPFHCRFPTEKPFDYEFSTTVLKAYENLNGCPVKVG